MRLTCRGRDGDRPGARRTRIVLHIGAPVTGTTYLHDAFAAHRRRLARHGVLYPSGHVGGPGQLDAVLDVLGLTCDEHRVSGAWDRLGQTARDWRRGTVLVSHELLADADDAQVQRVLSSFGPAEVHVVYAARDLAQQLPLAWQAWLRYGGTAPFGDYAQRVLARGDNDEATVFWRSHDVQAVLGRWAAYLPAARIHLLTAPATADADRVLWERLGPVLGVDTALLVTPAPDLRPLASLAALEAVRLLTVATGAPPAEALLGAAATVPGAVPSLSAAHAERLCTEAERTVAGVKEAGYDVVGDLTDLRPDRDRTGADGLVAPEAAEVVAAQTALLAALLAGRGQENCRSPW